MKKNRGWEYETGGIPDERFIRSKIPMTKEEIRAISLSKLRLGITDKVLDIGAGTGSMSIEAALKVKKGKVFAIEQNLEAVKLIQQNQVLFEIENIEVVYGKAPEALKKIPRVDKIFVGGSHGKIEEIFDWMDSGFLSKGRVVMNFITLENFYQSMMELESRNYHEIEVVEVFISKGKKINHTTMMKGQNPIYIISARKG
ncbi:precorrin-6Y C5,15-methyltransferase (decarboxylating) subunit CbiT [Garciella nitratireducens]|uniref:Cobalt-precorrin-6B (C15)-methyltransferase n=1 Tax=Garciella nitratireducens DSM 15102 TaxID=1121911 RepID=A0A1T4KII2_9FIRM|nr:precorrin-6Y C5,15-methyltransferase (decarboxylating) subunit CbiT [Garciella nitratireducens]RBP41559.1 cobalt-precorrin-6B (C15)-methyltransferase [Garciella nitratireducens]SJZ42204.1 cobalt-precorrin-6B (C15)-methyltransferase [Garciella nitratireducens DSM 15102]